MLDECFFSQSNFKNMACLLITKSLISKSS